MNTFYADEHQIESRHPMVPLSTCIEALRPEVKQRSEVLQGSTSSVSRERGSGINEQRPWLQQLDQKMSKRKRTIEREEDIEPGEHTDPVQDESDGEDGMWDDHKQVIDAVMNARTSYEAKREVRLRMFKISLLGGQWQMDRTGRSVYGLRCDVVKHSLLDELATTWMLKRSASFEYNVYSQEGAEVLLDGWMEIMDPEDQKTR
eukprot:2698929-Amphidinium_carterae.1